MYKHPAFCQNVLRTEIVLRAEESFYDSNCNPRSQLSQIFQGLNRNTLYGKQAMSFPLLIKYSCLSHSVHEYFSRVVIALMIEVDWIPKICYKGSKKKKKKS